MVHVVLGCTCILLALICIAIQGEVGPLAHCVPIVGVCQSLQPTFDNLFDHGLLGWLPHYLVTLSPSEHILMNAKSRILYLSCLCERVIDFFADLPASRQPLTIVL